MLLLNTSRYRPAFFPTSNCLKKRVQTWAIDWFRRLPILQVIAPWSRADAVNTVETAFSMTEFRFQRSQVASFHCKFVMGIIWWHELDSEQKGKSRQYYLKEEISSQYHVVLSLIKPEQNIFGRFGANHLSRSKLNSCQGSNVRQHRALAIHSALIYIARVMTFNEWTRETVLNTYPEVK